MPKQELNWQSFAGPRSAFFKKKIIISGGLHGRKFYGVFVFNEFFYLLFS